MVSSSAPPFGVLVDEPAVGVVGESHLGIVRVGDLGQGVVLARATEPVT